MSIKNNGLPTNERRQKRLIFQLALIIYLKLGKY